MSFVNDEIYFEQMSISLLKLLKFRVIFYSFSIFSVQVSLLIEGQCVIKSIHSFTQQMLEVLGPNTNVIQVTMLYKVTNNVTFSFLL